MQQQIADLLRQNQDLIRALQIREDSHSHKVTVQFEKFDEENENFDSFIERFETYLDVQNVPIANRAKVFVSSLSAKLYQLLKNLLAPDIPSDQTLDKLKDALKKHLTPKPLIIPSRHKFLNRKQTEGEGISTYIAELRALAMNCDYDKDMLNIMLRDVFVSGLRDKMILDRLFEEDNINLEKTLNIALAMEKAFRGTNDIMGRAINSMQTFKKHMDKNPILQKAERKNYIVHDAQVPTMQKRIVDLFQVNVIFVGKLGTLNRHASHLKRQMRNRLNKNRKISNKPIKPTNIVFKTYKGDSIIPLGYVTVRVQYKNQKVNLNLYIVKENLDTILGREWLYKIHLDWPAIKAFRAKTEQNLNNLLREYKDIFDDKLGEINNYEAKLKLRHGVKPIFCRVRTVPFALKGRVENEIDRLEKEGIIEKVDSSEWATPVVPVVKSDGSIRLCADYSVTLNPNLIVPQHPLPRLDEIFGSLNGGKQFTKLDFKHAYLQMKVHPDSQKLMTINTHKGLYICKRLMYGLNGAPAIWQRYVDGLFQGMDGVKVFMDDARITGSDEISHFTALEEFFKKCREHGLKLNLNKSKFFQNEINFLGHRIDSKGLHKTDEKISAVVNAPVPRNVHEVKSFLGLVNFYGKFCENLATIANPLNNLTRKNVRFLWSKDCQVAFEQIKKEICSPKILVHYDPSLPLTLASDASPVGIGCVLSHVYPDGSERPIAFASRTLSGSEKNTPKLIRKLFQ
ncbi:retrovirus-related Pol polyprotein from transposon 412 [Trichonephila clavipes]|nr:retrovirus-related Pol polyprotein from transposon 412 [Trichonephila clavipes]